MSAQRLLTHYDKIADAPDAIERLRRFILNLAVRGKLVPQDKRDEPASELLERIAQEQARLVTAGELRKPKECEPVREDELPIELPKNWAWARLCEIGSLSGGMTPSMTRSEFWGGDIVWLSPKDIKSDEVFNSELKISALGLAETRLELFRPGCLFMVARSGILKRTFPVAINRIPAAANQDMKVLVPFVDGQERYLQIMFRGLTEFLLRELVKTGTTVQSLKYAEFERQPFPLPPLAEQRRIVAKVDELMGLCDRLEAARSAREAVRDRLAAASLARLNVPDPETFQADARFALDALPALTTRPDQIKALRQTILNLAVRGKLVQQDQNDEPAANFDPAIPDTLERPFAIPKNWNWARLAMIGKLKGGGTPSKARDDFWNGNIPWVSPKDMKIDYVAEAQLSITETAIAGSAANLIDAGSVLFVVRGMILAHSFPVAISGVPLTINQDMKALTLRKPEMAEYILRALKGLKPEMLKRVQRSSHGTCRLEGADYSDFLVPIPPLAEQRRIVSKVNELMRVCDLLETSLTTTVATRCRLLDALLVEALAPSNDRELEAAE
ncbi:MULTISPECIES: restriction endonuclease subunit S [Bradyrhizobium]|jgi:type I restriction enzyme S subunit|uniref:restriction endonuclease subunit S n=1 Tax=Bradyrhizobium TaxID=374 RepID=UPI00039BDAE6|nr:restriction endonuclease subunit S [Bradyrhizobium denitrificans]MCL8489325.1 restriction endonuclease subunit S [Bradyrhizobium denitrificans]